MNEFGVLHWPARDTPNARPLLFRYSLKTGYPRAGVRLGLFSALQGGASDIYANDAGSALPPQMITATFSPGEPT
jgi:hypothetical protein